MYFFSGAEWCSNATPASARMSRKRSLGAPLPATWASTAGAARSASGHSRRAQVTAAVCPRDPSGGSPAALVLQLLERLELLPCGVGPPELLGGRARGGGRPPGAGLAPAAAGSRASARLTGRVAAS